MLPTVGLEDMGREWLHPDNVDLGEDLATLLPEQGLQLDILEIGGKGGHLRSAPRGNPIDGLLICYDLCNRNSFHTAAHLLMQHKTHRHLEHDSSAIVSNRDKVPQLSVVLCGTKADEADVIRPREISGHEALAFAQSNGIRHALTSSSKTGHGVHEVFHSLVGAILEAHEQNEAEQIVAAKCPGGVQMWGLRSAGDVSGEGTASLTSPRGERPYEPHPHRPAVNLVEVVDAQGVAWAVRPLTLCLERGLLHRAVHVWLYNACTGRLLLRRYAPVTLKSRGRWGPTCHGEIMCFGSTADATTGPHTAEVSVHAALRILRDQIGIESTAASLEHWFTCTNQEGQCHELLDVYVLEDQGESRTLQLVEGEDVEWVHFLDIFGPAALESSRMLHMEEYYRSSMVKRVQSRIVHKHTEV